MFAVDGLVKIRFPCASSTVTSIFVVVDFPEDPDTTTSPSGKCDRTEPRKPGATLFTTRPGTADPPPRLRSRAATRAARPTRTAGAQWIPGGRDVILSSLPDRPRQPGRARPVASASHRMLGSRPPERALQSAHQGDIAPGQE